MPKLIAMLKTRLIRTYRIARWRRAKATISPGESDPCSDTLTAAPGRHYRLERASDPGLPKPGLLSANLPPEILNRLSERISLVSLFTATSSAVLMSFNVFLQEEFVHAMHLGTSRATCLSFFVFSAGLFCVQRLGWLSTVRMLDVALLYQVAISFSIGILETSMPWDADAPIRGMTHLGVWFFVSGALLPQVPRRMVWAATFSIAAWFAAYQINVHVNHISPYPVPRLEMVAAQMLITSVWMLVINRITVSTFVKQRQAERLGSYDLDSVIGRGGMGEVWKARHKLLARDAAIKLVRPDVLHSSTGREATALLKRFEREARVTAHLRSPNTVALYDFGHTHDGTIYYVMELLDGIDLETLVRRFGPMDPARVVQVLIQVCQSLEEAHQAGLVHRDIKPRNVFLSRLGAQYDFVKVLDFGLVRITRDEDSLVTEAGIAAGTPAYIAPEVATAQDDIDGRADLYSVGCVAYFLLTGKTVFEERSAMAYVLAHIQKPVVAPSHRSERPVPPELEEIILCLLEKKPQQRIQSARELSHRLRSLEDVPQPSPRHIEQWWNLHLPKIVAPDSIQQSRESACDTATVA